MRHYLRPLIRLVLSGAILLIGADVHAQITRVGQTFSTGVAPMRGSGSAYDSKNRVYLTVGANGIVYGRFVTEDGSPGAGPFKIQASTIYAHFPSVAYSPHADGGAGAFLVVWHESDMANWATSIHARMVSVARGGPFGPDIQVAAPGSFPEASVKVEYSPSARQFLVAWGTTSGDVQGTLVGDAMRASPVIWIATSTDGEFKPGIACNTSGPECLISYSGAWCWPLNSCSFARSVLVNASTGSVVEASRSTLYVGVEVGQTEAIHNARSGEYFVIWHEEAGGMVYGRRVTPTGAATGSVVPVSTDYGTRDGLDAEYNPVSGTSLMVGMGQQSWENGGVEIDASGIPGSQVEITATGNSSPGNLYPRVGTHGSRPEWLVTTSRAGALLAQRIASGAVAGPPPPPPPPPCSVGVAPTAITAGRAGGAGSVNVSGTCAWTASSGASWMTITSGAAGNGAGMVGFAIARNTTGATRTGTLTVGGTTVTIQQPPFIAAATHDVSGDGFSDLVWHNQATGQIAAWTLYGPQVTSTYYLNGGRGVDTSWKLQGSGDLDGDGHADLLWRHNDGRLAAWMMRAGSLLSGSVLVYPGGVTARQHDRNWLIRGLGDLDGNGRSDVIWQHASDGSVAVWFMDGLNIVRTSEMSLSSATDPDWRIAGSGDINGDGRADLIWQHPGTGRLAAWMMRGATVVAQAHLSQFTSDLNWSVRGVGDVNGDGYADLLWQNTTTGALGVWYLWNFTVTHWHALSVWGPGNDWHLIGPG